jgi:hypothetical protein
MIRFLTASGAMRPWFNVLVLALGLGLLAGFTITYVSEQQRKICGLIVLMDDTYRANPPPSETGRRMQDEVRRYRARIGC